MMNEFTLRQKIERVKEDLIFKNNCASLADKNFKLTTDKQIAQGWQIAAISFMTEAAVLQAQLRSLETQLKKMEQDNGHAG